MRFVFLFVLVAVAMTWLLYLARKSDRRLIRKWIVRLVFPVVTALAIVSALILANLNFSLKVF